MPLFDQTVKIFFRQGDRVGQDMQELLQSTALSLVAYGPLSNKVS